MRKGIKCTISLGVFALFGCIQLGCEQASVKKAEVATKKQGEEISAKSKEETKPVASAPEMQKEAKAPYPVKKEEITSHPKDKRTIQQIISEITGEKMGADSSGDLYHAGLTPVIQVQKRCSPVRGNLKNYLDFYLL